jgi:hypothetical protein
VSDLLNTSAIKLQGLQTSKAKQTVVVDKPTTRKHPQNVEGKSSRSRVGATQPRGVKGSLRGSLESKDRESTLEERNGDIKDCDNSSGEHSRGFDSAPSGVVVQSDSVLSRATSYSEVRLLDEKGNSQDIGNREIVQQTRLDHQSVVNPKPFKCDKDHENGAQVMDDVLEGLPVVDSLQQPSTSKHLGIKGQCEVDQGLVPQTSSGEVSQESSESQQPKSPEGGTPFLKALDLSEAIHSPPRLPLEPMDEASQMSTGRTPRRKR